MNHSKNNNGIDELFGELQLSTDNKQWTVARTKSRCEKKLALYAKRKQLHYFLPLRISEKVYEKSKVSFYIPLFSGYLFVNVDYFDRLELLRSGYVTGFLVVKNQEHLLKELNALHQLEIKKVEVGPQYWLSKGLEVEIIKGPLNGTRAVVESHEKLSEVRLQVNILRQAVIVQINPADVKIIGEYDISDIEK